MTKSNLVDESLEFTWVDVRGFVRMVVSRVEYTWVLYTNGEWSGPDAFAETTVIANERFNPGNYGPADGEPFAVAVSRFADWLRDDVGLADVTDTVVDIEPSPEEAVQ